MNLGGKGDTQAELSLHLLVQLLKTGLVAFAGEVDLLAHAVQLLECRESPVTLFLLALLLEILLDGIFDAIAAGTFLPARSVLASHQFADLRLWSNCLLLLSAPIFWIEATSAVQSETIFRKVIPFALPLLNLLNNRLVFSFVLFLMAQQLLQKSTLNLLISFHLLNHLNVVLHLQGLKPQLLTQSEILGLQENDVPFVPDHFPLDCLREGKQLQDYPVFANGCQDKQLPALWADGSILPCELVEALLAHAMLFGADHHGTLPGLIIDTEADGAGQLQLLSDVLSVNYGVFKQQGHTHGVQQFNIMCPFQY